VPRPDEYLFDVTDAAKGGSAGSVTLILQTLLLPLAFAGSTSRLTLRGGTHVAWSPPYEYVADIFLPVLARMGLEAGCIMKIPGFYPVGGGEVEVEIIGIRGALQPLTLTQRGDLRIVRGSATACNLPSHIPQRMANRAGNLLRDAGFRAQITPRREMCAGAGAGIYMTAEYDHASAGFSAIGERGKPYERVAEEACNLLLEFHRSGAAVDRYLADQLLLPLALAEGRSSFITERITGHLITNAHIIKEFVDAKISIYGEAGEPGAVEVTGIGYRALTSLE
jgi:RNA 3'-terminal phosphate cyclase (ATP)